MATAGTIYDKEPRRSRTVAISSVSTDEAPAAKVQVVSALSEDKKLEKLVTKSSTVLFQTAAIFPFDLFPNSLAIDIHKVDLVYWDFFFTRRLFTILVKDIRNVVVAHIPFFASLTIEIIGYEQNPETIKFLPKGDALRARRIILGLMACEKESIDLTRFPTGEMLHKIEEIGANKEAEPEVI